MPVTRNSSIAALNSLLDRVIERALKGDRGGANDQWRIDNITMTYDPTDVGGQPPHIGWPEGKEPLAHAMDMNLIAAMRVDRQLRGSLPRRGGFHAGQPLDE